jgi:tetratricopeptide (TPR) repeat protein
MPDVIDNQSTTELLKANYKQLQEIHSDIERRANDDPDNIELQRSLALALSRLGRLSQAIRILHDVLGRNGSDVEALSCLGDIYQSAGHFNDAATIFKRLIECDPKSVDVYQKYFLAKMALEEFEDLNDEFERALVEDRLIDAPAAAVHPGLRMGTREFLDVMKLKADEGIPFILVNSVPRSGSTFLATSLCLGMNVPQAYLSSVTHILHAPPLPTALHRFAQGGVLARQHWIATPELLKALRKNGLTKLIVHTRDPRQAIVSAMRTGAKMVREFTAEAEIQSLRSNNPFVRPARYAESLSLQYGRMLESWIEVSETEPDFVVKFTEFTAMRNHPEEFFEDILDFYEIDRSRFDFSRVPIKEEVAYFRRGLVSEWREALTPEMAAQIAKDVPERVWNFFGWDLE